MSLTFITVKQATGQSTREVQSCSPGSFSSTQAVSYRLGIVCGDRCKHRSLASPSITFEDRELTVPIPDKSIAVLPFENLSEEKENAFFAGGVQDEILDRSRQDRRPESDQPHERDEIQNGSGTKPARDRKDLGVSHVVEGSVQRAGGRIRVSAQLIDARTDAHLWAEHYDRDLTDVFAIQSEVAQQIADQLRSKLSPVGESRDRGAGQPPIWKLCPVYQS